MDIKAESLLHSFNAAEFERFAFTILNNEARKLDKPFFSCDDKEELAINEKDELFCRNFDAVAPEGIYDDVKTYVIIKCFSKLLSEQDNQISSINKRFDRLFVEHFSKTGKRIKILLITNLSERAKTSSRIPPYSDAVELWRFSDLMRVAEQYPFEYNAFVELAIRNSTAKTKAEELQRLTKNISSDDVESHNAGLLRDLRRRANHYGITLVLGTGVSMDYNDNLSWDTLVERMYAALPKSKKFDNPKESFEILGGDNTSKAEYAKINLGNSYSTVIYRLLYPKGKGYTPKSSSLDKCADFISLRSRTVKKVITYNYDSFLEQALNYRDFPYRVLSSESDCLDKRFPIYHVHGYLPEGVISPEKYRLAKTLILSEEDYFNRYSDSADWMVAVQLETFKDDVCLFVGNSLADFNERRLLNKTKQKKKSHFAIVHSKGLAGSDLSRIHAFFYYELNVAVIWANTIDEIPSIIQRIIDSAL